MCAFPLRGGFPFWTVDADRRNHRQNDISAMAEAARKGKTRAAIPGARKFAKLLLR